LPVDIDSVVNAKCDIGTVLTPQYSAFSKSLLKLWWVLL